MKRLWRLQVANHMVFQRLTFFCGQHGTSQNTILGDF